jgi:hypothetical protein
MVSKVMYDEWVELKDAALARLGRGVFDESDFKVFCEDIGKLLADDRDFWLNNVPIRDWEEGELKIWHNSKIDGLCWMNKDKYEKEMRYYKKVLKKYSRKWSYVPQHTEEEYNEFLKYNGAWVGCNPGDWTLHASMRDFIGATREECLDQAMSWVHWPEGSR